MGWFNHQLEKQAKSNEWKISFPTRDQVESPSRRPLDAETASVLGDGKMEIGLLWDTVDGSEIRRSPVDMKNISLFLRWFYTSRRWCRVFVPSTVF